MRATSTWLAAWAFVAQGCAATTLVLHEEEPVVLEAVPPETEPAKPKIEVAEEEIEVDEKIHFALDSAQIKEESHSLLDDIAQVIREHDELRRIEVQGHTDSQGGKEYNEDLSKRRAQAVVDYLVQEGGVRRDRLVAKGYGYERPLASNDTKAGRSRNRRVEFHILERK